MTQYNKKLALQVLRLCEKQYLKGLQHGASGLVSREQAQRMRDTSSIHRYKKRQNPFNGCEYTSEEYATMMAAEANMIGMAELIEVLRSYAP
jgi:hypothetical protein